MTAAAEKKLCKPSTFQVLLLDNSQNQDVEVQEAEQVDFCAVKKHLKNGGSVFITSRESQKISHRKSSSSKNYSRSRYTLGLLLHQNLRS